MKKLTGLISKGKIRLLLIGLIVPGLILGILAAVKSSRAAGEEETENRRANYPSADANLPPQIDVRGGTPRGLDVRQLTTLQSRALTSLQNAVGGNLTVRYNGLTATPMNIVNPGGYLTAPNAAPAEQIAREFIGQWREVFRFDQNNLNNLKLMSRAVSPEGITVMLFQQQANNLPVYHGEVLVNVNQAGRIINIGGDSFPRLSITNSAAIDPATAVSLAATDLGVSGFSSVSLGATGILTTYGDLNPEYATGQKFARSVFTDDIDVQTVVFPLGDAGRIAYKFNLTSALYHNIVWMNIVDAQTGAVLKRTSLTSYFGEPGGGTTIPRKGTFRPDVQNMVEGNNATGTARGKVFDTMPTTLSRVGGGATRAVRGGTNASNYTVTAPTYDAEALNTNPFRYSIVLARNENPLPFTSALIQNPQPLTASLLGQVTRGFPDAANPSASSPFGWFYLPTNTSGTEITQGSATTGTTRVAGYGMASEAQTRNLLANSPNGNGAQPFSADLTALGSPVSLPDGRVLSSVYQSRYTEGNNVTVSDDRANDNDATKGIKGYSANRQFNASYFDYLASYEFGGTDASGGGTGATTPVTYPASSNPDVYADTTNLFYFNNVEHDYLYSIGFTEPFWNFQFDNFGKGGAGNDAIVAEVQDGSGTDNANMSTPAEGSNPRMQMYLFTDGGFRRSDGDLDWDVVAHEHYHGVSNRSAAKGGDSCLGTPLVGESGGMGEGWSDSIAASMSDDDAEGEYVTGQFDNAIRRLTYTNYRYSYGSINDVVLNVRKNTNTDVIGPDANIGGVPYEVHDIGEVWAATLWDMRELMIVKQKVNSAYPGIFFDGTKRIGGGTTFFVGDRPVQSIDTNHPINYRQSFLTDNGTTAPSPFPADPTLNGVRDIVRPKMLATENAANPQRNGPLATAVARGARLADTIVLRGLQLAVCNPTFVDMRDSMLAADREVTGGENQAIIWRAFASHGVGTSATSTGKTNGTGQQGGPAAVVEDFTVPTTVTECELLGPLPNPAFSLSNTSANSVSLTITAVAGATQYIVQRSDNPNGPFATVLQGATSVTPGQQFGFTDDNLVVGNTYYYQVHARRNTECVGESDIHGITITIGTPLSPPPVFAGLGQVADPRSGTTLNLSWSPAASTNQGANMVYDIYRVINVTADTDLTAPMFIPTAANRIAQGVTGTTYTNSGLTLGQQYYYIVQARDTTNGKIDTNNTGNTVTKLHAPSSNQVSPTAPFALENFETAAADNRFTLPLTETASPDRSMPVFQRTTGDLGIGSTSLTDQADATTATTGLMFAPDFDPGNAGQGGPSDFSVEIAPTNLSRASFLEFDHRFNTEATFDGDNLEILLGSATLPVTPMPDNTTTFDLNDYIVENTYSGKLDGTLEGAVMGSPLLGRRSFTGSRPLSHVRVAIGDFAPGGLKNPNNLPVYIRFHATSDAGTFVDGWYLDNLVVNNYVTPVGIESDVAPRPNGDGSILSDDVVEMRRFLNQSDTADSATTEFQRADSAPLNTRGDGMILSDDIVQTRRYQNGSDAQQSLGGPTAQISGIAVTPEKSNKPKKSKSGRALAPDAARSLRIESTNGNAGRDVTVNVRVDATGDEAEYGFIVNYDQTKLVNPRVGAGNAGAGVRSCNIMVAGKVNCSVGSFPNNNPTSNDSGIGEIGAGDNQILITVTFTVMPNVPAGTTPVTLTNVNASNDLAQRVTITSNDGTVTLTAAARKLHNDSISTSAGRDITINVRVDATGDEAEYGFIVNYDQTKLSNPRVGAGNAGAGVRSCNIMTAGRVNCSVGSFPNNNPTSNDSGIGEIGAGDNQILITVTFTVAANAPPGTTPVTLTNVNASNDAAQRVTITSADGTVTIASPTAAGAIVAGRVLTRQGRGIPGVMMTINGFSGEPRTMLTNPFGYYSFSSVAAGETYIVTAKAKRYTFDPSSQVINLTEDLTKINFIGR